jgi:hypothetical protein
LPDNCPDCGDPRVDLSGRVLGDQGRRHGDCGGRAIPRADGGAQFDQIYSDGADDLKKSTTEQSLTRLLDAVDRKLGTFKSAQSNGWSVNYNTSGTSVTMKFKTEFEKGSGVETFVYRITGGKALLAGYQINSADMMIN